MAEQETPVNRYLEEFDIKGMHITLYRTPSELYHYIFSNNDGEQVHQFKANWRLGRKELQHFYETGNIRVFREDQ